ncbi:hypothetical protein YH65_08830 [Sulfurovum lithotrophicum]|uniref:DUF1882 domain-containing protein n=1 Tax=Sulfurovum lithotrophicum TaxID=206403 RepID=A0A7U4RR65_9BACT|nr:DUF1882 domain-containing protein [Sulfurovum lithotrophicum]AKF25466.1 hypothetical protein YH65_08830 [Sulfurovum lithotrophicum]
MKVFDLDLNDGHYYIKHNTIVEKIHFDNRTFYAKFERIEEPLTPLLLTQHLNKQYTIAAPLLDKEGLTNYLVLEYRGDEHQRFYYLVKQLFRTFGIKDYHIYRGKHEETIQVFIEVKPLTLQEADDALQKISDALKEKLGKKWKTLPSASLPEAYNIVTLPYKEI